MNKSTSIFDHEIKGTPAIVYDWGECLTNPVKPVGNRSGDMVMLDDSMKAGDTALITYDSYPVELAFSEYEARQMQLNGLSYQKDTRHRSYHMAYALVPSRNLPRAELPLAKPIIPYLLTTDRMWGMYYTNTFRNLLSLGGHFTTGGVTYNWPVRNWLFKAMYPEYVCLAKYKLRNPKVNNSGMSGGMHSSGSHFRKPSKHAWMTKKLYYQTRSN